MAVFPSAAGATDCAVSIQQRFERRNRDAEEQLAVKIGTAIGDATREGDDYFGMPAILAARLCAAAAGGQILVAELVKMMVGGRGEQTFTSVGALELKGIPEPMETYEVGWEPIGRERPRSRCRNCSAGYRRSGTWAGRQSVSSSPRTGPRPATATRRARAAVGRARDRQDPARELPGARGARGRRGGALRAVRGGPGRPLRAVHRRPEPLVEHAPDQLLREHIERHGSELSRLVPGLATRVVDAPPLRESDPDTERYLLLGAAPGCWRRPRSTTL